MPKNPNTSFEVRRLSLALGAEVSGLDLTSAIPADTMARLRKTWLEHHVLVFRGQLLSPAEQIRFSEYFGQVDDYPLVPLQHPQHPQLMVLNSVVPKGGKSTNNKVGARWHSDLSFTTRPATASLLHSQEIPPLGGDTLFANQYMAYDSLSPLLRQIIDPLSAACEVFSSRSDTKDIDMAKIAAMRAANPPVAQPMVRVHPETGRKALYVSPSQTTHIVGMTPEEGAGILQHLFRQCTKPDFVYRHQWRVHDLVIWDNRCLLHIAMHDYGSEVRRMHRTTITGAPCGRLLDDVVAPAASAQQLLAANV